MLVNPPIFLTDRVKVTVDENNMKAFVTVKEPGSEEETEITSQIVLDYIRNSGVKFGLRESVIDEIIESKSWGDRFLIAEGVTPINGEPASLELCFPTDISYKPQIKEDGHVDYKEVSIVHSTVKDHILVRKTPASKGMDGMDVYGHKILTYPGKDCDIKTGQGTYRDPENINLIKAAVDGIICYHSQNQFLEVQKLYVVQNSVDYSTGNINVKSSIEIKGDVKPDFSVTTPYNIEVKGVIEQASINCDGSLTVKIGIKGAPDKLIKTGGDIHANYIQNAQIKCRGSVYSGLEIRNTTIECDDQVVLVKAGGVIIGGKIMAVNNVTAASISNLYYVPTEIEVGINLQIKEKILEKEGQIKAANKLLAEVEKKIETIEKRPPGAVQGPSVSKLKEQKADFLKEIERLRNRLKEIQKDYFNVAGAFVSVSKTVYPGTIIKISGAVFEVKEELSHVIFRKERDEIKYTNLK
ncbi:MAG: hypothetical protein CVV24_07640 [Ignavibacteriae bacterium HGW-Ignavibacteriae-3]|nr:MAG: hypothetical protein CVV24_07640 [Ignavibacteriae bacterium HGW-Ignavibacteriae-3]